MGPVRQVDGASLMQRVARRQRRRQRQAVDPVLVLTARLLSVLILPMLAMRFITSNTPQSAAATRANNSDSRREATKSRTMNHSRIHPHNCKRTPRLGTSSSSIINPTPTNPRHRNHGNHGRLGA